MEDSSFRSRAQGAVDSERMELLRIIAQHWDELQRYEYGGGTAKQRWDLWEAIGNEFNAHPSVTVMRTPLQIKTLFKNMKTKAKKYQLKLESSKYCGLIIESDPVSEVVLQLTKVQSQFTLNTFLEALKKLQYFNPESENTAKPITQKDIELYDSADSADWNMSQDSDDVPDIKEEVIEAFDSPCIIREDESPIVFPANEDQSENSSEEGVSLSDAASQAVQKTRNRSETHTFGDIVVTPIASEKKSSPSGLRVVSPLTLGLSVKHHSDFVSDTSNDEAETVQEKIPKLDSGGVTSAINAGRSEAFEKEPVPLDPPSNNSSDELNMQSKLKSICTLSTKCDSDRLCCCPEYHKRMLSLANKEHEMNISLYNEKLMAKREERRLHEEERRFREQNFLLKQEERRAVMAEHQARMKLMEYECEAAQKRLKSSDRANGWIFRWGSKEI